MSENHNLILGIDGGGTKTVACLAQSFLMVLFMSSGEDSRVVPI